MAAQAREIPLPLPADDIFDSNTHNTLAITVPSRDPSVSRSCARPWFSLVLFNSCLASTVTVSAGTLPLQSLSIDRCNQLHKIKVILRLSASHGHTSCILASQCTGGCFLQSSVRITTVPRVRRGSARLHLARKGDILNWWPNRV